MQKELKFVKTIAIFSKSKWIEQTDNFNYFGYRETEKIKRILNSKIENALYTPPNTSSKKNN